MISNIGKYYLYRHIRLDTGEPFYIGIVNELKLKNSTPILRVIKKERKHFRKFIWERL